MPAGKARGIYSFYIRNKNKVRGGITQTISPNTHPFYSHKESHPGEQD